MLSEPLHGQSHRRFDVQEPPRAAGTLSSDALSSLKRSLAVNLNEREKFRNQEQLAREQLERTQSALSQAQTDLNEQRKESAALRSQLEDQAISQKRLQEQYLVHSTVGGCLEASCEALAEEVKNGDKAYNKLVAWFKDESEARQELSVSAQKLKTRLQHVENSLTGAEQNVSDLHKVREVLEGKLAEMERAQVATSATHAAELEKFDYKVQEALAAKDELYGTLVSAQQVQGELNAKLVGEQASAAGLKSDLMTARAEYGKAQEQLQQLTTEHTKLAGAHEEMCTYVKDLKESCSALQADKSDLTRERLQLESESHKAHQDYEGRLMAISDELKHSEEARAAMEQDVEEALDKNVKIVQERDAAAAAHEAAASKSENSMTALQAEVLQFQEQVQVLQKVADVLEEEKMSVTAEKLAGEEQLQDVLQQVAALEAQLETARKEFTELEVSLVVQSMAKNVCDADSHSQISKLTTLLGNAARDLEKTKESMQTISDEGKQHSVKRLELEAQVSALSDQIAQERASNKAALEEQSRYMKADNDKALCDIEAQAADFVKNLQQNTGELQAQLSEKDSELSKLKSELDEVQRCLVQRKDEVAAAAEEHSASIARLEAAHAARMSSKDVSESKVKSLLDETEADKQEKMAELSRVQQALTEAKNKLKEEQKVHKDSMKALQVELDQEQDENEQLKSQVSELREFIDLSKCEKKSVEAELEKLNILLRKFQGGQVKGSEMTPMATPRSKTKHGSISQAVQKNTPSMPGSSSKKRKRSRVGDDSASQEVRHNKKKHGVPQSKPPIVKPALPSKKADGLSVQMQRRGRLARMSNSAAASDRPLGVPNKQNSQAALTSTEIFGGLLLGNL